jgi:hypothetical protein
MKTAVRRSNWLAIMQSFAAKTVRLFKPAGQRYETAHEVVADDERDFLNGNLDGRFGSLLDMQYFAPFFLFLSVLPPSVVARSAEFISPGRISNGADRTITWGPWQQNPTDEFRFRTGDRYLGLALWEHYLGFEQHRASSEAIKLSMIRLGNKDVGEEAVLRPGSRYAIFKISNGTMTSHKGAWSWTAQKVP